MFKMFDNAGIKYCYESLTESYVILGADGAEEIRTHDALSAWSYYIERVDMVVRRRIRAKMKKDNDMYKGCE